jgi:hypothetical protein
MTTILAVYHKGRFISSCDKRCYSAMQPTELREYRRDCCRCICNGANHGVGLTKALLNYQQRNVGLTRKDVEQFAAHRRVDVDDLFVVDRLTYRKEWAVRPLVRAHFAPPKPLPLLECEGLGSSGSERTGDNGECTSLHRATSDGSVVQGRGGGTWGSPTQPPETPVALKHEG